MKEDLKNLTLDDVEDVFIVLKIKNKHYSLLPKKNEDNNELKQMRITLLTTLLDTHIVISKPIEDISRDVIDGEINLTNNNSNE
jgi:hypothetical protein